MADHSLRITSNPPGDENPYRIENPSHKTIHVKRDHTVQWKRDPKAVPRITKLTIAGKGSEDQKLLSKYFGVPSLSHEDPQTRGRGANDTKPPREETIQYSIEVEHEGAGSPYLIDPDMVMDT